MMLFAHSIPKGLRPNRAGASKEMINAIYRATTSNIGEKGSRCNCARHGAGRAQSGLVARTGEGP